MTFLGEWGDRSQITTIALAIEGYPWLVFVGGFLVRKKNLRKIID